MTNHIDTYGMLYLLIFVLTIGSMPFLRDWYICHNTASNMNVECHYSVVTGCYIKQGDKMVPLKSYRKID